MMISMPAGASAAEATESAPRDFWSRFFGVWIDARSENTQCAEQNWEDANFPFADSLLKIDGNRVEWWEDKCDAVLMKAPKPEKNDSEVHLACVGENAVLYNSKERWQIRDDAGRRRLIRKIDSTTDVRDEHGKAPTN